MKTKRSLNANKTNFKKSARSIGEGTTVTILMQMKLILLLFILVSCSTGKIITNLDEGELNKHLGKKVTIQGKTVNAKLGALLITENGNSIWINNLKEWPEGYYLGDENCKTVIITGRIIQKNDLPVFIYKEGDPDRSGMPVPEGTDLEKAKQRFLIKKAKWKIIDE